MLPCLSPGGCFLISWSLLRSLSVEHIRRSVFRFIVFFNCFSVCLYISVLFERSFWVIHFGRLAWFLSALHAKSLRFHARQHPYVNQSISLITNIVLAKFLSLGCRSFSTTASAVDALSLQLFASSIHNSSPHYARCRSRGRAESVYVRISPHPFQKTFLPITSAAPLPSVVPTLEPGLRRGRTVLRSETKWSETPYIWQPTGVNSPIFFFPCFS